MEKENMENDKLKYLDELIEMHKKTQEDFLIMSEENQNLEFKFKKWCIENKIEDALALVMTKNKNFCISTSNNKIILLGMANQLLHLVEEDSWE